MKVKITKCINMQSDLKLNITYADVSYYIILIGMLKLSINSIFGKFINSKLILMYEFFFK